MTEIHPDFANPNAVKFEIVDIGDKNAVVSVGRLLLTIDMAHDRLIELLAKNGLADAKYLHTAATFLLAARAEAEKYSG